jgi:hypothetical protein
MEIHIVLVSVEFYYAREVCENIENNNFPTLEDLEKKLKAELRDRYFYDVRIMSIGSFTLQVNDQLLDNLTEYFISYVKIG